MTRDLHERVAVVEVKQEVTEKQLQDLVRQVTTIANNVLQQQAEANADRELARETLRVIAATHGKVERNGERMERAAVATEKIAGDNETYLRQIHVAVGAAKDAAGKAADAAEDAADNAARAAENTGRVPLLPVPIQVSPTAEKSGPAKAIVQTIFRAPVAKILAVAVLVVALAIGAVGGIIVLQEVRAIKARLGGAK